MKSSAVFCTAQTATTRQEYPIIDGVPIIVASLQPLLAERVIELLLRDDLDPALEGLIGDALGAGSWFDALRQTVSTYAWDGWAMIRPKSRPVRDGSRRRPSLPRAAPGTGRPCFRDPGARCRLRRRPHHFRSGRPPSGRIGPGTRHQSVPASVGPACRQGHRVVLSPSDRACIRSALLPGFARRCRAG